MNYTKTFKAVLCGDQSVGKTSIVLRFTTGNFTEPGQTIGADFSALQIPVNDKTVNIHLWDTAGQEKYQSVGSLYFRNSIFAIIVYDVSEPNNLESVNTWISKVSEVSPNVIFIIVGNKTDLVTELPKDVERWCKDQNFDHFFCSALKNDGISQIFYHIAKLTTEKDFMAPDKNTPVPEKQTSGSGCWC